MTDTASETTTEENTTTTETTDTGDLAGEVEKWKTQARKHEDRAKANAAAAKELEALKQSTMSDIEKAVAEAKAEGRAEGLKESAVKVASASIRAAAAGRLDITDDLLEGINLSSFVDESGDVDDAKVTKFVDSIAPKSDENTTTTKVIDLGQGSRTTGAAGGDDPLLASVKKLAGI